MFFHQLVRLGQMIQPGLGLAAEKQEAGAMEVMGVLHEVPADVVIGKSGAGRGPLGQEDPSVFHAAARQDKGLGLDGERGLRRRGRRDAGDAPGAPVQADAGHGGVQVDVDGLGSAQEFLVLLREVDDVEVPDLAGHLVGLEADPFMLRAGQAVGIELERAAAQLRERPAVVGQQAGEGDRPADAGDPGVRLEIGGIHHGDIAGPLRGSPPNCRERQSVSL